MISYVKYFSWVIGLFCVLCLASCDYLPSNFVHGSKASFNRDIKNLDKGFVSYIEVVNNTKDKEDEIKEYSDISKDASEDFRDFIKEIVDQTYVGKTSNWDPSIIVVYQLPYNHLDFYIDFDDKIIYEGMHGLNFTVQNEQMERLVGLLSKIGVAENLLH